MQGRPGCIALRTGESASGLGGSIEIAVGASKASEAALRFASGVTTGKVRGGGSLRLAAGDSEYAAGGDILIDAGNGAASSPDDADGNSGAVVLRARGGRSVRLVASAAAVAIAAPSVNISALNRLALSSTVHTRVSLAGREPTAVDNGWLDIRHNGTELASRGLVVIRSHAVLHDSGEDAFGASSASGIVLSVNPNSTPVE